MIANLGKTVEQWRATGKYPRLVDSIRVARHSVQRVARSLLRPQLLAEVRRTGPIADLDQLYDRAARGFQGLITPCQDRGEFVGLLQRLRDLQPRTMMEIGTATGGSLFMFARVIASDGRMISLDLPGGAGGGGYPEWKVPLYQSFALPGQELTLIRGDTHDPASLAQARAWLGTDQLDFLFLDGDHSYEGVRQDFHDYAPLVRPGGMVAFHDITYIPEVRRFWDEVRTRYPSEELVAPHQSPFGIGILRV